VKCKFSFSRKFSFILGPFDFCLVSGLFRENKSSRNVNFFELANDPPVWKRFDWKMF